MNKTAELLQEETIPKPVTGIEFLVSLRRLGLVGLWKDRTDITDSSEYARNLRDKTQERGIRSCRK